MSERTEAPEAGGQSDGHFLQDRLRHHHAAGEHIAQFFAFGHLSELLRPVSIEFARLAVLVLDLVPRNPERTVALRKLLEAKDAAVRARVAGGSL